MNKSQSCLVSLALLAGVLASIEATACDIPVCRYALDRWTPDVYRLEAPAASLANGPIASDLRGDHGVRINLEALPLASDAPAQRVVLRFPSDTNDADVLWSGELTAANYRQLTSSPARTEIAKRLLAGESGVWVLVDSGNADANQAVAKLLDEQSAIVAKTAILPIARPDDPSSQVGPGPKIQAKFSILRVSRTDPAEQFFLSTLAGPGGLATFASNEPFAALVFGRGRVLGAWSPEKLTAPLIEGASRFLLASCSCEAKQENPGWDLLMRVNWDAALEQVGKARIAAGDAPAALPPAKVETVTYEPAAVLAPAKQRRSFMPILVGAGLVLLVAALVSIVKKRT